MKKIIISLLFAFTLGVTGISAQNFLPQLKREKPDMAQIKKEITDRTSEYYYPRLMKEHLSNDTVMKTEKYRRLYLGYMLQEDYDPYRHHQVPEHIQAIYNKNDKITRVEADSIIAFADRVLADNPFDLRQMLYKIQGYRIKGKTNNVAILECKLKYILYAIMSTGTGRDRANAWWIVSPDNEYFLLNYLGFTVVEHENDDATYEILTARDADGFIAGDYYFNISRMIDEYYLKHPDEEEEAD